jgi:diguanylate cyclase (GGDEF)-like protein/PAS domain S-box-containing protein
MLIILPFVAAIFIWAHGDANRQLAQAGRQTAGLLRTLVDHRDEPVQYMRSLAEYTAQSGAADHAAQGCGDTLARLLERHPWAEDLWVADAAGHRLCSVVNTEIPAKTVATYVEAVHKHRGFSLVAPATAVHPGQAVPVVLAVLPIMRDGTVTSIVGVSVSAAWMATEFQQITGNADVAVVVGTAEGEPIASFLHGELIEEQVTPAELRTALRHPPGDITMVADTTTGDIVAMPLGATGLTIAVTVPHQQIVTRIERNLWQALAILGIIVLSSFGLGLLGIELALLRPLGRFDGWLAAIGNGDYRRTQMPKDLSREFRSLADALSRMTAEIEAREEQLRQSENRYRLIAENMSDMIMVADSGLLATYVSHGSKPICGKAPDELLGRPIVDLLHPEHRPAFVAACIAVLDGQDRPPCTLRVEDGQNGWTWIEATVRRMPGATFEDSAGLVIAARDISQRKIAEDRLAEANRQLHLLATSDALTKLGNRRRFDDAMAREWRAAERRLEPLSLLFADVDHFKMFNDRYGHPAGDACLKKVSDALRRTIRRPTDLPTRYGGEEFAILLPNTDEEGAGYLAEKVRLAVRDMGLHHADNPHGRVTVSIGVATIVPRRDLGMETLIARADRALYAAKKDGRNLIRQVRQDDFNLIQIPA